MSIVFDCPSCGKQVKSPESSAGKRSQCPLCKHVVTIPAPEAVAALAEAAPLRVVVVGVDMPLGDMAFLFLKWTLATIPTVTLIVIMSLVIWAIWPPVAKP